MVVDQRTEKYHHVIVNVIELKTKTKIRTNLKKNLQGMLWIAGFICAFTTLFYYLDLKWASELTFAIGLIFLTLAFLGSFGSIELSRSGIVEKEFLSKREFNWTDIHSMYFVPGANPTIEIVFKKEFSLENPTQPNPYKLAGCYDMEPKEFVDELLMWWRQSKQTESNF